MFESKRCTRRSVVLSTGTLALTALAGCSGGSGGGSGGDGGGSGGGSGGDGGGSGGGSGGDGGGSGGGEGGDTDAGDGSDDTPQFDGWMENVANYDGVVDETGSDEVTVSVGAQGNGGAFAFEPPAVRISTGTTVVWEWTGEGAQHNVVAEGGAFESDLSSEAGFTFEHTLSEAGTHTYACTPHESLGMKGAVVVE